MPWTFFRYVGPEQRDVIREWIGKEPDGTRGPLQAALDVLVSELELSNKDQFGREDGVGQLRRKCGGFFELILKVNKVQYRPVGVYGPERREFTLLTMDKEKGNRLIEDPACKRAKRHRDQISDRRNIREYFPKRNPR